MWQENKDVTESRNAYIYNSISSEKEQQRQVWLVNQVFDHFIIIKTQQHALETLDGDPRYTCDDLFLQQFRQYGKNRLPLAR